MQCYVQQRTNVIGRQQHTSSVMRINYSDATYLTNINGDHFYRTMHFRAKRGIAIACRLYVRLSVCL